MLTCVRFLSSVDSHVVCKVPFVTEALSILRAGERLFSSVNSHVGLKRLFMYKSFSTLMAGVSSFSCVSLCGLYVFFSVIKLLSSTH